jgi:hypothetical protein
MTNDSRLDAFFERVRCASGAQERGRAFNRRNPRSLDLLTLRSWAKGRVQRAEVMVVAAIWLLVSGAAAAVWTIHLASTTGDLEAWAVLANLMVAAQGALLAWMAMTRSAEA